MSGRYPDRYYHPQELLEMAYRGGQYWKEQGKDAEPLTYIAWMVTYYAGSRPESFYREIVEWYQAGYAGLVRSPGQWQ